MAFLANRLRSRVNAPGLHLQSGPGAIPKPVRFHAPALTRLLCLAKCVRRVPPVVWFVHQNPPSVPGLSLPFGTFQSLRLVALHPVPAGETYLASCPISFAPRSGKIVNISAPDHRSRFATSCQARCARFGRSLPGAARRTWCGHVCNTYLRVLTLATGTAPAFGRPLAPRYGSDLLPLRLLSLLQRGDVLFHAAPLRRFDELCQVRSLPAAALPLRAPLV